MIKNKKKTIMILILALAFLFGTSVPITVAYIYGKAPEVTNIFVPVPAPEHDLNLTVKGEKKLTGRDWAEGDVFSFKVQKFVNDKWANIGNSSVVYSDDENFDEFEVSNIVKGSIEEPGLHHFRISEVRGLDSNISYDDKVCRFDITVSTDDMGNMKVDTVNNVENTKVTGNNEKGEYVVAVSFTNAYNVPPAPPEDPDDIEIEFAVNKTVKNIGKTQIGPEGFKFRLEKNSTGEEWFEEVDKTGSAVFEMTYTKENVGKVYLYELTEVNDGKEGVTYSDKVYDISVGIELSKDNELIPTIKVDDKKVNNVVAEFENTYTDNVSQEDPTKPHDPSKPSDLDDGKETGDDSNITLIIVIMAICIAVILAVVLTNRRKHVKPGKE